MSATNRATFVQRALGGHAAIGLLASALLYIIALTGTLIVIHDRWQRWEQPEIAETAILSPDAAQTAMRSVVAKEAGKPRTTHFYIRLPTDDLPRAVAATDSGGHYVDGAGLIVGPDAHSWTEFLIGLHEYLHLPNTLGLIVVGALGVALATLVVTGVLAHPRILKDAFRLRTRHDPQIARADWHNRLGVWTLPFVLAVAVTGAFIGLGSVGATVLARAYTGGEVERIYAPMFGHEPKPDAAPAPLPDIATAMRTLAVRAPEAMPIYVTVHAPGTRGQHIQILAEHSRRLIYGESYRFDARGGWLGPAGLSRGAIGQQVMASSYNLHFGNYAGLPVEIAYILFGLALCVVTATGTTLWLRKRRRRGHGSHRLEMAWELTVWGVPLLLVAMLWLRALAGPDAPLALGFWGLFATGLAIAIVRPEWIAQARLRAATMMAVLATAIVHLTVFWFPPLSVAMIDVLAIAGAAGVLWIETSGVRTRAAAMPATARRLPS